MIVYTPGMGDASTRYKQIPNQLTLARLVLAAAFFTVLGLYRFEGIDGPSQGGLLVAALVLFIVAAITDALDGWLARRWHAVSLFGRVVDPVADKLLIIGAFILLCGPRFVIPERIPDARVNYMISGIYPWMVVVILLRELLVTSIRAALESRGVQFPANWAGKWKMILQAVVIPIVIAIVWYNPLRPGHEWAGWVRDVLVYTTVLVTILSGIPYITRALAAGKKLTEGE
jgi:phosphatidylglycerophosphate synthase